MKRPTLAARLALAVVTLLLLARPVAAGEQVPFHGSLAGTFDNSGFPIVSANFTGNATHLGRFTLALPHTVTANGHFGTFVFIAANGDTVTGSFTGVVDSVDGLVLHVTEIATIEGGTGRFADASGGFTTSRSVHLDLLTSSGSFHGTISSPGK